MNTITPSVIHLSVLAREIFMTEIEDIKLKVGNFDGYPAFESIYKQLVKDKR